MCDSCKILETFRLDLHMIQTGIVLLLSLLIKMGVYISTYSLPAVSQGKVEFQDTWGFPKGFALACDFCLKSVLNSFQFVLDICLYVFQYVNAHALAYVCQHCWSWYNKNVNMLERIQGKKLPKRLEIEGTNYWEKIKWSDCALFMQAKFNGILCIWVWRQ